MTKKKTQLFVLSILVILLAGCTMWINFTTYFNRYYNAKEKFLEAEEAIKNAKKELFEFRSLQIPVRAKKPLESVVKGCSKILQYNKKSSYVNDALFLIGKAFYYEQNYLKADRKFAELYAQGPTELYIQSKLWLGKTKLQLRNFELGLKLIDEVIDTAVADEKEEVFTDAIITRTSFYVFRNEYELAVESGKKLLEVSDSDELKAEVAYEIGRLYLTMKKNEEAVKYFAKVEQYTPTFEIEVLSKLEVARLKSRLGKSEESLELLEDMKDESKYEKFFDKIDLERGVVNIELGNLDEALDILTEVDTVYKNSEANGLAKYFKGVLYEEGYGKLDSARVYYKKAFPALPTGELKTIAFDKEKSLGTYINLKKEIDSYYIKYNYLADSTLYIRDSLEYERLWNEDSLKLAAEFEVKSRGNEEVFKRSLNAIKGMLDKKYLEFKPEKNTFTAGQLNEKLSKAQYEMGLYFYNDVIAYDSARYYFDNVLTDYPDSIKTPQLFYTLGSFYHTVGDTLLSDSLFNIVYNNYSTELIANEAAKRLGKPLYNFDSDPAKNIFIAAEKEYNAGNYQEALQNYKKIFKNHRESPYAPKSLLASSYIYRENIKNVDSVVAIYDSLTANYAETEYAKVIASKQFRYKTFIRARQDSLNKMLQDSLELVRKDSLAKLGIIDSLAISADSNKIMLKDSIKVEKTDSVKPDNKKKLSIPLEEREVIKSFPDTLKTRRDRK